MRIGAIVQMDENTEQSMQKIKALDITCCQLAVWDQAYLNAETAQTVQGWMQRYGMEVTALWCGWGGPQYWNFYEGPLTLGLVPREFRQARLEMLMKGSEFAKAIGVTDVVTHMGFLPENPAAQLYQEIVIAIRLLAEYLQKNGQYLLFETGQETPVTLRRTINDVGLENLGVNLDPANLLLYGKANPVDALDIFGDLVRGVHAKDGEYPTDGHSLGQEKPLGEGRVDFPRLISKLKDLGYDGAVTIEREISGEQQMEDIRRARDLLRELIK